LRGADLLCNTCSGQANCHTAATGTGILKWLSPLVVGTIVALLFVRLESNKVC